MKALKNGPSKKLWTDTSLNALKRLFVTLNMTGADTERRWWMGFCVKKAAPPSTDRSCHQDVVLIRSPFASNQATITILYQKYLVKV